VSSACSESVIYKSINVLEFRKKVKINSILSIDGVEYKILEIVKFRFSRGKVK
jgi:hypothetical protein